MTIVVHYGQGSNTTIF